MIHKRTKIVATLGPASESVAIIRALVEQGVNVFRLNFSHGTYENHALLIANIRTVAQELNQFLAIMQDLQGPKIRLGTLPSDGVDITDGETIVFHTNTEDYHPGSLPIDYHLLHQFVKMNDRLLINDGRIETKITDVTGTKITVVVTHGGHLESHKGINVPDSHITASSLTEKDRADAAFGIEHGVDYMALSFVKTAADVQELRTIIETAKAEIKIIAKIERPEAVANIKEILTVADGIMIARGDLGIEIPPASVPITQKDLVASALSVAKPVIVATQMLDSMQTSPRATRAEVSDVATAVIDHADAVMLSNESATGSFPVETVTTMSDILVTTEASRYDDIPYLEHYGASVPVTEAMSNILQLLVTDIGARAIITASPTGSTAAMISRHRLQIPVLTAVAKDTTARQLAVFSGIYPFLFSGVSAEDCIQAGLEFGKKQGMLTSGEKVIVAFSDPFTMNSDEPITILEVKTA